MSRTLEIQDREDYKARMNALLRIDPARTVALTVDMQLDYLDAQRGTAPLPAERSARVIKQTRRLLELCRAEGIPVVHCYVRRRHAEAELGVYSTAYGRCSQRARLSQNPNAPVRSSVDRVEGSVNAELPAELVEPGDVHVTSKRQMDSFYLTDLDMLLGRVFKPETLLITGINTDTCVYATTFAASHRGYQPVVIADCTGSMRGEDHHRMALELMARTMAWVLTTDEVAAHLQDDPARV